jgi:predicted HTH transcriptional regulator
LALSFKESLVIEFKSDRNCLPDRDLLATVISLANTEGGELYLGVEDNGEITGLHSKHRDITTLAALIGNKSYPPLSVRAELREIEGQQVAVIKVPKSRQLVATSEGLLQRRRLMADGTPQAVPFYPHEFIQRQVNIRVGRSDGAGGYGSDNRRFKPAGTGKITANGHQIWRRSELIAVIGFGTGRSHGFCHDY